MKGDIAYAISIILIGVVSIFWLIPYQTPLSNIEGDIPSSLIPNIMMIVVLCGGIFQLVISIVNKRIKENTKEIINEHENTLLSKDLLSKNLIRFLVILFSITSYVFGVSYIGFYTTTAVFLTISLYVLNSMSIFKCVLSSFLLLLISYLLFEVALKVSMPQALLI
jgi:hypothetical protein